MSYQVVDISDWPADSDEELGARDKLWVSSTPSEEVPDALWKEGRPGDKVTEPRADLWAEKIAAEVAALMGVPAARVDLAQRGGVCGVLSWRMDGTLTHGNQLLSVIHPDYQAQSKGRIAGYDLPSIERALEPYRGWDESLGAFDCFPSRLTLVDLASQALGMVGDTVAAHWREAVARVDTVDLKRIIAGVPEDWMSEVMRTFVLELVIENRRRLLT